MHRKLIPFASLALLLSAVNTASAQVNFSTRGNGIAADIAQIFSTPLNAAVLEDGTFSTPGPNYVAGIRLGYDSLSAAPVATDILVSFWDTANYNATVVNSGQIGGTYRFSILAAPAANETSLLTLTGGPIIIPDNSFAVVVNFVNPGTSIPNLNINHLFHNVPVTLGTSSNFSAADFHEVNGSNGIISGFGAGADHEVYSWDEGGEFPHANLYFELTVPEPGSIATLGLGVFGLALRRRRMV